MLRRKHLVERASQRVQVGTDVDRQAHPAALFRRHVGESARVQSGAVGRLVLSGETHGKTKPCQPCATIYCIDQDIVGTDVPVNQISRMKLLYSCRERCSQRQEHPHLHWAVTKVSKQFPPGIVEHECDLVVAASQRNGDSGPSRVQPGPDGKLVLKTPETLGVFGCGYNHEYRFRPLLRSAVESQFALPKQRQMVFNGLHCITLWYRAS